MSPLYLRRSSYSTSDESNADESDYDVSVNDDDSTTQSIKGYVKKSFSWKDILTIN